MSTIINELKRAFRFNLDKSKEPNTKARPQREQYLRISSRAVKILVILAWAAIWFRFILKEVVQPVDGHWSYLVSVILLLLAMLGGIGVSMSTFWFTGNAPEKSLDERELSQRNRVYVRTVQVLMFTIAFGWYLFEIAPMHSSWSPDLQTVERYLFSIFFSALLLPTFLLAVTEPPTSGEVEDDQTNEIKNK